jgi:hypothetical protein
VAAAVVGAPVVGAAPEPESLLSPPQAARPSALVIASAPVIRRIVEDGIFCSFPMACRELRTSERPRFNPTLLNG